MYERTHREKLVNFNKSGFSLKCLLLLLTVTPTLIKKEKKKVPFLVCGVTCATMAQFLRCFLFSRLPHNRRVRSLSGGERADLPGGRMLAGMKCCPHSCHKAALGNGLARAIAGIR